MSARNRTRAELYARADYYAATARASDPPAGSDPHSGRPWSSPYIAGLGHAIGRASRAAAARTAYEAARGYPNPLPGARRP